jgi:hypothetical protein
MTRTWWLSEHARSTPNASAISKPTRTTACPPEQALADVCRGRSLGRTDRKPPESGSAIGARSASADFWRPHLVPIRRLEEQVVLLEKTTPGRGPTLYLVRSIAGNDDPITSNSA